MSLSSTVQAGAILVLSTADFSDPAAAALPTDFAAVPATGGFDAPSAPGTALPEGIRLAEIVAVDDVTPAPQPPGFVQAGGDAAQPASRIIYFHPDGTTSTATLILADEFGMALQVQLRGLTGAVAKGEPLVYEVTP
ncbi:MAG: hypothetical protein QM775_09880 [Pirellulales bacterium]